MSTTATAREYVAWHREIGGRWIAVAQVGSKSAAWDALFDHMAGHGQHGEGQVLPAGEHPDRRPLANLRHQKKGDAR